MNRCLYCYRPLPGNEADFHPACSKKLFGQATPPLLPYTEEQMEELAKQTIRSQVAVTGVQPPSSRWNWPPQREKESQSASRS